MEKTEDVRLLPFDTHQIASAPFCLACLQKPYWIRTNISGTRYLNHSSNWVSGEPPSACYWGIERLTRVTGLAFGDGKPPRYFSEKAGDIASGPYDKAWETSVSKLYRAVYRTQTEPIAKYMLYNLYGVMYPDDSDLVAPEHKGKFHTGVDLYWGNGATIYCPFKGTVVGVRNDGLPNDALAIKMEHTKQR